jgi:DNA polymerase
LRKECTAPVHPSPGYFNLIISGEAPGFNEDQDKKGFTGRSGKMVWDELIKYNLNREDFHVTNANKCFPKETKTPTPAQIKICSEKWLFEEIKEIECRLILAFGNTNVRAFTDKSGGIKEMNGRTEWNERVGAWVCWCLHPSFVLRNPNEKNLFEQGIKNFVSKIELLYEFQ